MPEPAGDTGLPGSSTSVLDPRRTRTGPLSPPEHQVLVAYYLLILRMLVRHRYSRDSTFNSPKPVVDISTSPVLALTLHRSTVASSPATGLFPRLSSGLDHLIGWMSQTLSGVRLLMSETLASKEDVPSVTT